MSGVNVVSVFFLVRRVGLLLSALSDRLVKTSSSEDWLLVLTTDHGGSMYTHEQGLGLENLVNRYAWVILNGEHVRQGEIVPHPLCVDIVPTIMTHFRIPIRRSLLLDGRPVGVEMPFYSTPLPHLYQVETSAVKELQHAASVAPLLSSHAEIPLKQHDAPMVSLSEKEWSQLTPSEKELYWKTNVIRSQYALKMSWLDLDEKYESRDFAHTQSVHKPSMNE